MSDTVLLAVVTLNLVVSSATLFLQVKHYRAHRYPQRWADTTEPYLGSDVGGLIPWEKHYGEEEDTDED